MKRRQYHKGSFLFPLEIIIPRDNKTLFILLQSEWMLQFKIPNPDCVSVQEGNVKFTRDSEKNYKYLGFLKSLYNVFDHRAIKSFLS